ncbi:MAG: hypothetical protein A2X13_02160 [Bacteroidetes bacterium GWC2_33_15]|nr:MAG: hypothetical protein A2X10_07465 [Bacteroidetes bacterium GWA2_33_15]OFX52279.1 MAG: hypothetical protein A2X13_02160 [Bacteroidetes bacterium GWC2_33_15]OFX64433.1 MAG: hypothetical protein A2X15_12980 [Bacteroidetes bacterium GWB2_32_14]OFX67838.1 MAG: hypothetical protein A2X14_06805 [Bacteroidetes bacterium GWD2_33_33]HAN19456.1 hypothetical protein [Bacteroidales bacterium]
MDKYKFLFVEDQPVDTEMAVRALKKYNIEFDYTRIETENDFIRELKDYNPDLIISDYSMPLFNGMQALKISKEISPDLPFIVLTGSINEETAVQCMKAGATDYILKDNITRLPFAVMEAVKQNKIKLEKQVIENNLKESEERYKSLFHNNKAVILIIDPETRQIVDANPAACEFYGWPYNELISMTMKDINRLSETELKKIYSLAINSEKNLFVIDHYLANGEKRTVEVYSGLIKSLGKNLLYSIVHDISERKKAEEKVKLLNKSIEQSPVSIAIVNPEGFFEYVNPRFTEITGYSYDEAIGQNPNISKSGIQSKEFYDYLWKTILSGKNWQGELVNKKKDGNIYWENVIISPIIDEKNVITHFVAIIDDITEKKRMLNELIEAKEKAEESDRLKTAFLANISHEIRTPMNGILGFSDMLVRDSIDDTKRELFLDIIRKSGTQLLSIIDDIIDISKIETGQIRIEKGIFDLNEIMDYTFTLYKPKLDSLNLDFELIQGSKKHSFFIESDKVRLQQIITNLLNNALKFTLDGGIQFGYSVKQDEDEVEFYVKDSGIGIAPEHQSIIFDRFRQVDEGSSRNYGGTGLGLSISKALVEKLGGEIWVESGLNKGSVFYFTIPVGKTEEVQKLSPEITKLISKPKLNTFTPILIVDDEEINFLYLKEIIDNLGIKNFKASNGIEAIEMVKKHPEISLILMDLKMPRLNGYEASAKIKELNPEIIIIAQTAYAQQGDKDKAIKSGCDDYISKPINEAKLINMIMKYLG